MADKKTKTTPTKKPNFIKSFFEMTKMYWGYFMTTVAIFTFVWTLGVKSEKKDVEKQAVSKSLLELTVSQTDVKYKIDSVIYLIKDIHNKQNELIDNQNALRNSFVKYISNDNALSKKDFIEYMQGIQWNVNPITSVEPVTESTGTDIDTVKYVPKIKVKPLGPTSSLK